jgi:hypothetical protein
MTVRYDIRQVTRYVLVRMAPTGDTDIAEYKRRDLAEQGRDMAEQAVRGMESMGPLCAPNHPGNPKNASIRINGDIAIPLVGIEALRSRAQQAASMQDIANKIQAERLAKARNPSPPVNPKNAYIRINGDIAIPLVGIDALDTKRALELLEARVMNAKRTWQHRADEVSRNAQSAANQISEDKHA